MKEVTQYQKAKLSIEKSKLEMVSSIRSLLVKGYSFGEISEMLDKSKQAVWAFYRDNSKNLK